jgi:hypothetical protein
MNTNQHQCGFHCLTARRQTFKLNFTLVQFVLLAGFSEARVEAAGQTNAAAAAIIAPQTIAFRRVKEPKEGAFSFLAPPDWKTEINLFRIDPMRVGGWGNSYVAKCDLTVKKDDAGTVMLRSVPTYNYVDFSANPRLGTLGAMFRPGSYYQGMQVKPMPTVQGFLDEMLRFVHPRAQEAKVTERMALPELAAVFAKLNQSANAELAAVGGRITFTAGVVVVEYTEGGVRYKEAAWAVLSDNRALAGLWANDQSMLMRAPLAEAKVWQPILETVMRSIRLDVNWLSRELRASEQRAQMSLEQQHQQQQRDQKILETQRELQRMDQEIWSSRAKTNERIQHDNYLTLTAQQDYVNPHTHEVETDTSDYRFRWETSGGEKIFSNDPNYDPRKDTSIWTKDWQPTPAKK